MRNKRWWVTRGLSLTLLTVLPACGGDGTRAIDRSTVEAKVAGKVKVHGQAMRGGEIRFTATNSHRKDVAARTLPVGDDGSFDGMTLVGRNEVRISGPALKKEATLGYVTKNIDVQEGDNPLDLDFP